MSPELIGIIVMGVALAGLMLVLNREDARALRADMAEWRAEMRGYSEGFRDGSRWRREA